MIIPNYAHFIVGVEQTTSRHLALWTEYNAIQLYEKSPYYPYAAALR